MSFVTKVTKQQLKNFMSYESKPNFIPDEVDDRWSDLITEEDTGRRTMIRLDLGPMVGKSKHDIGPSTVEEEDFFEDADDSIYTDQRLSTGTHCMDDNVQRAGMQLPGGLLETWSASRMLDYRMKPMPKSELYARGLYHLQRSDEAVWVHGKTCAAAAGMRDALLATAAHSTDALEFTGLAFEALKVNFRQNEAEHAILVGHTRSGKEELWDLDHDEGLNFAKSQSGVKYEEFNPRHKAAGIRIDVTREGNLFNNALFRQNHVTQGGEEVGLLSVTLSAYRNYLYDQGLRGKYLSRELTHTALFTFGMAKVAGHDYIPAALIQSNQ
ncbi:hypothetical protein H0X09_01745 [Candidatus Saccharibacteria bacterium]|nr:hypothetical protein [Candidatus Saccharibacteria bacterium]